MKHIVSTSQKGTALIAALLLVALMAAISVQLIDLTRFSLLRTAQIDARTQAYWYARGARDMAEGVILNSGPADREVMRSDELWLVGSQTFPIKNGMIIGSIRDGNNCININALSGRSDSDDDLNAASNDKQAFANGMFSSLVEELGVPAGLSERLKNQIIDWIDKDQRAEPGSAEDDVYARFNPPYRAANQRFFELEELLALPDMTAELYQTLRPWLCVRPSFEQPKLNLNTLKADQALLLTALFHGDLTPTDAQALLFRRPVAGYQTLDDFWTDPIIGRIDADTVKRQYANLHTQWFVMEIGVDLDETEFNYTQLVKLEAGGAIARHSVRFGVF